MFDTREPGIADAVIRLRRWNHYRYEQLGYPVSSLLHRMSVEGAGALSRATGENPHDPWDVEQVSEALNDRPELIDLARLLFKDATFKARAAEAKCGVGAYKARTLKMLRYVRDYIQAYDGT